MKKAKYGPRALSEDARQIYEMLRRQERKKVDLLSCAVTRAEYNGDMNSKSEAQKARNDYRDSSGRMRANKCECCGKKAPMDYFSAGPYVVLCEKCCIEIEAVDGTPEEYQARKEGA